MTGDRSAPWESCSHGGCHGARLAASAWCLAHAAEQAPSAFDAELKRISTEGSIDARGVQVTAQLLERILDVAPLEDGRRALSAASFDAAIFQGGAGFNRVIFEDGVVFSGATFRGGVRFDSATFRGGAWFIGTTFRGGVVLNRATFLGGVVFSRATFRAQARFIGAVFQRETGFDRAIFYSSAGFNRANFQGDAVFDSTTFQSGVVFDEATFGGAVVFNGARFQGEARFIGTTFRREVGFDRATFRREFGLKSANFEQAGQIGPLVARQLLLDGAVFNQRVQVDVVAAALCARRAQFASGVHFRLRWASVILDDANLAAPAILASVPPFAGLDEDDAGRRWRRLATERGARPRLLSLCRADVAGLRVANVDLRACRFAGAHNLDRLRIEGEAVFARTHGWWRARRKTLAEEQHWRASRPRRWRPGGWYPPACQAPAYLKLDKPAPLAPVQLAALYRELRKGREDAKDEPGAADFYYGEMELRRRDPGTPRAERLVLALYWLVSGYALRAWRALAALATVVLLAAVVFTFWGFSEPDRGFRAVAVDGAVTLVFEQQPLDPHRGIQRLPAALRFTARSATALLRGPDRPLTPLGEWLDIALRFLGPVLLGLAVLSVRGRVRR